MMRSTLAVQFHNSSSLKPTGLFLMLQPLIINSDIIKLALELITQFFIAILTILLKEVSSSMNFNFSFAIINIRIILTINNTDTHCNYDITQCGNIYYTLF